jgi:hypothetical protein
MNRVALLVLAAMILLAPLSYAAGPKPWRVSAEASPGVKTFKRKSMFIEDMRIYDMGNWMVYGGDRHHRIPLLPIYDLIACFSLTNPDSLLDVESGGGVEITVDGARFKKGKWDSVVRLTEHTRIEKFDKELYLLLDLVRVGASDLKKSKHKIGVVRIMAEACLKKAPPKSKAKSKRG